MRKFLISLLIIVVSIGSSADPFFSLDKADHFMTAMVMTLSASIAVRHIADSSDSEMMKIGMAAALPVFFSFAKEVYDGVSGTGTVSYKDLIYDFAGIILGLIIAR